MPILTEPVKRVCYADDLTVCPSGVNIPDLEELPRGNNCIPKGQFFADFHPKVFSHVAHPGHTPSQDPSKNLHREFTPATGYMTPSLSFNKHSQYVVERVSGGYNILEALAGTSWGQQKETLLMTYKAVGRSIINYAAPVWSPNLHDTNYRKIQYTQNEALRIATGWHKMSSIDHLHTEAEMLKVREHSELLSSQYLARCLEPENIYHPITTRAIPERQMKETLYTRHENTGKLHSTLQQSLKLFSVTRGMWC